MLEKTNTALKRIYTTIFSQTFSSCGNYLAVSDNYGDVTIFTASDTAEGVHAPIYQFQAFDGPAFALKSYDKFLIVAGTGLIKAFDWVDILAKSAKPSWTLNIPNGVNYDTPEANSIAVSQDDKLYAGCGDSHIHIWNLDSGAIEKSLKGHSDYVHGIALCKDRLISAGEDGNVLVWDTRVLNEAQHIIQPWKNDRCARPGKGKFMKCAALDNADWLICGGGPKMSLWHLQSLSCTTILESESCPNTVKFHEDGLVSGGSMGKVEYWNMDGTVRAQVPCKPRNIFSICSGGEEGQGKLAAAGSGATIDVFTSIAYSAYSLQVR